MATLNAVVRKTVTVNTVRGRLLLTVRLIPAKKICSAAVRLTAITLNVTVMYPLNHRLEINSAVAMTTVD